MTATILFPRARRGDTNTARRQGGQATVEFAFLLPLIVLAALAVIQVGLVVRDQMGVVHAAREAVRAASVNRDPGAAARAAHRTPSAARPSMSAIARALATRSPSP